jgi:3-methyladenine DNA glycosylase AlkD
VEIVAELRSRLAEVGDPARAPDMQRYMKSSMPFRGVSSPVLKKLCREVYDAHRLPDESSWIAAVRELWDEANYREERYAAVALTQHRAYRDFQQPRTLELYRHLVVTGAWWDHVDPIATRGVGGILAEHRRVSTPVVRRWAVDDDMWLRRTAILSQLHHKDRTDLQLLRHVIEVNLEGTRHRSEFFVRKSIGWALRQQARVDPDWVLAFVDEHDERVSGLSRREALKHLRGG